jgi:hypothetical protein
MAVEKAYATMFLGGKCHDLILGTVKGQQNVSKTFKNTMKILEIISEYIQKHTSENNGDIELVHNSLKGE